MEQRAQRCVQPKGRSHGRVKFHSPHRLSPKCRLQIFHHLVPHFHFLLVKGKQSLHLQIRREMEISLEK